MNKTSQNSIKISIMIFLKSLLIPQILKFQLLFKNSSNLLTKLSHMNTIQNSKI